MTPNHTTMEDVFYCPECGSSDLYFDQRGFDSGRALKGAFLFGKSGFLAGFMGSQETVVVCNRCGCVCNAGPAIESRRRAYKQQQQLQEQSAPPQKQGMGTITVIVMIILLLFLIFAGI